MAASRQRAGSKSVQVQANTLIIGIDEKRAREIVDESLSIALENYSNDAETLAKARSERFGEKAIRRMVEEKALSALSDPAFQILLQEAQKSAASTEREPDYDLLSELMIHRFKSGDNRNIRAGVSRAVEIVDQISDEALLALTLCHSLKNFIPNSGDMALGLKTMDDLFGKLLYAEPPKDTEWIDHLDILDAVRFSSSGGMRLLEEYWSIQLDGYLQKGIDINSENFKTATNILSKNPDIAHFLAVSSLDNSYRKIYIRAKDAIKELIISKVISSENGKTMMHTRKVTGDEVVILESIYDLYDDTKKMSQDDFAKEIEKFQNLKKLRGWWNTLNEQAIQITSVGRVLAQANAQRVDNTIPSLD